MTLDDFSNLIGIVSGCVTILALFAAGWVAYGIYLASATPDILIEGVCFWPPSSFPEGTFKDSPVISMQFRFLNPAIGSKVVSEIMVDRLDLELDSLRSIWFPIRFLEPLTPANLQALKPTDISYVFPISMIGHGREVRHVAFVAMQGDKPAIQAGALTVKLLFRYRVNNPLTRVIKQPEEEAIELTLRRSISQDEIDGEIYLRNAFWPSHVFTQHAGTPELPR